MTGSLLWNIGVTYTFIPRLQRGSLVSHEIPTHSKKEIILSPDQVLQTNVNTAIRYHRLNLNRWFVSLANMITGPQLFLWFTFAHETMSCICSTLYARDIVLFLVHFRMLYWQVTFDILYTVLSFVLHPRRLLTAPPRGLNYIQNLGQKLLIYINSFVSRSQTPSTFLCNGQIKSHTRVRCMSHYPLPLAWHQN